MTNREKFKEVFGIDIPKDEHYFCNMVTDHGCDKHGSCEDCPAFEWWDKEYNASITSQIKASVTSYPVDWKDIHEKLTELKGIVKILRIAESKMSVFPFNYEDRVVAKEMIKFCADDIEELMGGKRNDQNNN